MADLEFLTPAELKAKLKISTGTYTRLMGQGRLPFRRVASRKRFVWNDVIAALPIGPEVPRARSLPLRNVAHVVTMMKYRAKHWPKDQDDRSFQSRREARDEDGEGSPNHPITKENKP